MTKVLTQMYEEIPSHINCRQDASLSELACDWFIRLLGSNPGHQS
jgi:hypothetical protein